MEPWMENKGPLFLKVYAKFYKNEYLHFSQCILVWFQVVIHSFIHSNLVVLLVLIVPVFYFSFSQS